MGQRFIARERRAFSNGAVGWAPGGPFDCLGPYAKVERCPIVTLERIGNGPSDVRRVDTGLRRTCYATGYADSFFSVPACAKVRGRYVGGFFVMDDGACVFVACFPIDAEPATWARVREPNLHGSTASNGQRSALVCQTGSCPVAWEWFAKRDGRIVVTGERGSNQYRTERAAQRHAEGYLTTGRVDGRDYDTLPLAVES